MNLAWAAGLFEGEGSCVCVKKSSGHRYLRLALTLTDEDVLQRFCSVVGVGTISGPRRLPGRKPIWTWQAGAAASRELGLRPGFCDHLGGRRRRRIAEIVAMQDANPAARRRVPNDPLTGAYRYA